MKDRYLDYLQQNEDSTREYYLKSLEKTEQQKLLESILDENDDDLKNKTIVDLACGGGTLAYHLSSKYKLKNIYLIDYNQNAITLAKDINSDFGAVGIQGDIYKLPFPDSSLDYVFCWQTLSWIDKPEIVIDEIMRVLKSGGKLYASSLFNIDYDVDLLTQAIDYTTPAGKNNIPVNYYTYAKSTVDKWLNHKATYYNITPFQPSIDFSHDGNGLGTRTLDTLKGKIQISGGLLLNWGILCVVK